MEREIIADRVSALCERFDDAYWLQRDRDGRYPHELREALARDGWLGITVPEAYGGSGLGVTEATAMMQAISESGAGFGGASSIAGFVLFPKVICAYGTDAQKQRWLPGLMSGEDLSAFGITEPNAGLDTSQLQTRADRVDGGYVVNGSKVWNSNAQVARKLLFLARTSPKDEARPFDGISLFYTDSISRTILISFWSPIRIRLSPCFARWRQYSSLLATSAINAQLPSPYLSRKAGLDSALFGVKARCSFFIP